MLLDLAVKAPRTVQDASRTPMLLWEQALASGGSHSTPVAVGGGASSRRSLRRPLWSPCDVHRSVIASGRVAILNGSLQAHRGGRSSCFASGLTDERARESHGPGLHGPSRRRRVPLRRHADPPGRARAGRSTSPRLRPGDCGTMTENRWAISARRTRRGGQGRRADRRHVPLPRRARRLRRLRQADAAEDVSTCSAASPRRWSSPTPPKDYMMDHEHGVAAWPGRPASSTARRTSRRLPLLRRLARSAPVLLRSDRRRSTRWATRSSRPRCVDITGAAGEEGRDARLPRQPARVAAGPSRHRRVHRLDAAPRGHARPARSAWPRPRPSCSTAATPIRRTTCWRSCSASRPWS